jgi:hypothetical protein
VLGQLFDWEASNEKLTPKAVDVTQACSRSDDAWA